MKIKVRLLLAALVFASLTETTQAKEPVSTGTSEAHLLHLLRDASLAVLKEGNNRFATGKSQHPNLDSDRRTSTVSNGQEPIATVLSCSDSRSPAELIFDRGVGDLFIVRVAGNIAGESELATVEYGVDHLGTPILLVMGHTKCGAVTAVVKGTELHGHLPALAEHIKPAVAKAKAKATSDLEATIASAIEANVWWTVETILKQSELVRERARSGRVLIVGAVYDLETGRVQWLGSHPAQAEFLAATSVAEGSGHGPAAGANSQASEAPANRNTASRVATANAKTATKKSGTY